MTRVYGALEQVDREEFSAPVWVNRFMHMAYVGHDQRFENLIAAKLDLTKEEAEGATRYREVVRAYRKVVRKYKAEYTEAKA